jgi:hypothetical protein
MPEDRDIIDERDEDGRDAAAIERRLTRALKVQTKVTTRMNAILSVAQNPGPPTGPQLCDQIVAQAQATITAAQSIKRIFSGPDPSDG